MWLGRHSHSFFNPLCPVEHRTEWECAERWHHGMTSHKQGVAMFQPMICPEHAWCRAHISLWVCRVRGRVCHPGQPYNPTQACWFLAQCSGSDQGIGKGLARVALGFHHCGDHMVVQALGQSRGRGRWETTVSRVLPVVFMGRYG